MYKKSRKMIIKQIREILGSNNISRCYSDKRKDHQRWKAYLTKEGMQNFPKLAKLMKKNLKIIILIDPVSRVFIVKFPFNLYY